MPNDPYLDASVRWKIQTGQAVLREPRYREVVDFVTDSGLATEVLRLIGSGKEADVYLARDGTTLVAVKVYRTYRTANQVHRTMKLDAIGHLASWEFELLNYAWSDGAPVPRPIRREEHAFAMQYVGSVERPAPRLKDVSGVDMDALAPRVVAAVERLVEAGVVHTDLSPYNILVDRSSPWIIDVGKCLRVDRLGAPPWLKVHQAREALTAGAQHLARFFAGRGVRLDAEALFARWSHRIERFGMFDPAG
jgi:RIO kinase 1